MLDILVDTNVLLRSVETDHSQHYAARHSIAELLASGNRLCILPQNVIEFWGVATRSVEKNELGWSTDKTDAEVSGLEAIITVLLDKEDIYREWRLLVRKHSVLGKQVHDTRIVAAMKVHGIRTLPTFNSKDFKRFADLEMLDPEIAGLSEIQSEQ